MATQCDEVQLLAQSSEMFKDAMVRFRNFIDVYRYTKDIEVTETVTKIEQCAVDFRYTCDQTASIVERLSNGWIEDAKIFFENLEDMTPEDSKELSTKALQYSQGFKTIHGWVTKMAGNLHDYIKTVKIEQDEVIQKVEEKLERAREENLAAERARVEAEKAAKDAEDSQFGWWIAAFIPVVNFVGLPMYMYSRDRTDEAGKGRETATLSLVSTERVKTDAEDKQKKIKEAANKIAELAECLVRIEGICEGQVQFWKEQGDKFATFSSRMSGSKGTLKKKAPGLVEWLEERQEQLRLYYDKMQEVTRRGHFVTKLTPTFLAEGTGLVTGYLALTSSP